MCSSPVSRSVVTSPLSQIPIERSCVLFSFLRVGKQSSAEVRVEGPTTMSNPEAVYDPTMPANTVWTQPSLWWLFINPLFMYLSQVNARDFLPPYLVGTRIRGIPTQRLLLMPFASIAVFYALSANLIYGGFPLHGHALGCMTAAGTVFGFSYGARISMWYAGLAASHASFGYFHHYRKLCAAADDAPLVHWSDWSEIWEDLRGRRAQKAAEKTVAELVDTSSIAATSDSSVTSVKALFNHQRGQR